MAGEQTHYSLVPKLFTLLRQGYSLRAFLHDLNAGVIVGIVALPLAIAFAIASGVKPEQGLYTAVVAGFLISALGGSRYQIGGPTGAFVVIVYGIMAKYGYDGLAAATLIAGVILILMGMLKIGSFIKFIPYPVTVGFTAGIALIIFTSQLKDFFGLPIASMPSEFVGQLKLYAAGAHDINPWAAAVGALSLLILMFWARVVPVLPGSLAALVIGTLVVHIFHLPVETIGSRFGHIPHMLPAPRLPRVSASLITTMFSPALTIALLAGIESLLSAVVADGMTGRKHRSNAEIVAQGIANIGSALFMGIPATGAIARTATNIKCGARTPVAGIVHSVALLLIMLCFGRYASLIPLPVLAAILVTVAYNMSHWHTFLKAFRYPKSDIVIMLLTLLLTVLVDLTVAIQTGVIVSALLFMHRISEVTRAEYITQSLQEEDQKEESPDSKALLPQDVEVFEIYGAFFFGAVDTFKESLRESAQKRRKHRVFILRMRSVIAIDAAGLQALEDLSRQSKREGVTLVLSGVHAQPLAAMEKAGLLDAVGRDNVVGDFDGALERARSIVSALPGKSLDGRKKEA
jgi:SulP family sulfate permease